MLIFKYSSKINCLVPSICLILIFAGCALFASPHIGRAAELRELNIVENNWPPYFFAGKPDQPEGFAKELLKELIPETEYATKFTYYPVKRMYYHLEKGGADIAIFSYKKKRESFLVYGKEPLFVSKYQAVVLAESGINIQSLKDFDTLKVGHLAGLKYSKAYFEYVEKRKEEGTLVIATTGESCLKMLLAGIIDVFVDTRDTILWRAKENNALDKIKVLDFHIQEKGYFVTVSKKSEIIKDKQGFLNTLDRNIKAAKKDGRFTEIAEKYGL